MAHMVQTHDGWVLRDDWFIDDVEVRLEDYFGGLTLTKAECVAMRAGEASALAHLDRAKRRLRVVG